VVKKGVNVGLPFNVQGIVRIVRIAVCVLGSGCSDDVRGQ
jgi:hypothetical protein